VTASAQPPVMFFIEGYKFHKQAPTFIGLVQQFRAKVVRLQRRWRMQRLMREAYVATLMKFWEPMQDRVYNELVNEMLKDPDIMAREKASVDRRLSGQTGVAAAALGKKELLQQTRQELSEKEGRLPRYLSRHILYEYVKDMWRELPKRVREWEELQKKAAYAKDLEAFGVQDVAAAQARGLVAGRSRPRPIYIDPEEMERKVVESVNLWRSGAYTHLRADAHRVMKNVWRLWSNFGRLNGNRRRTSGFMTEIGKNKSVVALGL